MLRGIERRQEVDPGMLLRDTRTFGQKLGDFFRERGNVSVLMVTLAATIFWLPALGDVALLFGFCCFLYTSTRRITLPFRLPISANTKDYNDLSPGTGKPNQARGITYFGNEQKSNEELWFHNQDMRTHVLIFGSTGSGKTETLISLAYNALLQASGFIYVDGKGDNSLYAKIFSMVRSMGREDDILLVNFMTGARDIVGPQDRRLSNTLNPFSSGSSSMLSQLVISLMESSSQSSDGDMWKGRAIAFVEALMKILVYMRDQGVILLDANTIRNYFTLDKLESIVMDKVFPRTDSEGASLEGIPDVVLEPIRNYLFNLPGYNKQKKGKQVSQVLEQHGFITMQLTRVFSSLADTYGHILRTNLAEVDFKDVVLNRRILVVLLPALEKSPDELSNLGKVIIASLKAMMAAGLGEEVQGEYRDVVERKPTNSRSPFLCILDEYGYYAVQGFAVVPAQARSLGFSAIFAGQDLPAFQKASKEEAASIGANTNIKICMKLEDPTETWEFFTKTAGEAYVTKVDAFQTQETSITNNYLDTKSSSFEKRARIDLLDLKDQSEGEMHIFFQSKIIRARSFYANPKPARVIRLNQLLKVDAPSDNDLYALQERLKAFNALLEKEDFSIPASAAENADLQFIAQQAEKNADKTPIDQGVATLMAYHERKVAVTQDLQAEAAPVDSLPEKELDIFEPLRRPLSALPVWAKDVDAFSQPLLDRAVLGSQIVNLENVSGKSDAHAHRIAQEMVKDMELVTHYPAEERDDATAESLAGLVNLVCERIRRARKAAE